MNIKQNNRHAPHTTHCRECGRILPNRCHRRECATCIKRAQGRPWSTWPDHDSECRCGACLRNIERNVAGIRETGRMMGHYQ